LVGVLREVIDDGVTGFLCPPERLDLMAERSLALLTDAAGHSAMARAAVEVVRSRYGAELVVPSYEALYREVLGGPPRR
jgi:L-malate glycosyltransferase